MIEFLIIIGIFALFMGVIRVTCPPGSYVRKENHNPPPKITVRPTRPPPGPPPKPKRCGC